MAVPMGLGLCGFCANRATIKDVLKFSWCADHQYRAAISAYGQATRFRAAYFPPYAIAEGEEMWKVALAAGTERFLRHVYASIQGTDTQTTPQADIRQKGA